MLLTSLDQSVLGKTVPSVLRDLKRTSATVFPNTTSRLANDIYFVQFIRQIFSHI